MRLVIWRPKNSGGRAPFSARKTRAGMVIDGEKTSNIGFVLTIVLLWAVLGFMLLVQSLIDRQGIVWRWFIGSFGGALTIGMIVHEIVRRRQKPILTFDAVDRKFFLPRQGVGFRIEDAESFVVVDKTDSEHPPCVELRIRARNLGSRRLLRAYNVQQLEPVIRLLTSQTGVPVISGRTVATENSGGRD